MTVKEFLTMFMIAAVLFGSGIFVGVHYAKSLTIPHQLPAGMVRV